MRAGAAPGARAARARCGHHLLAAHCRWAWRSPRPSTSMPSAPSRPRPSRSRADASSAGEFAPAPSAARSRSSIRTAIADSLRRDGVMDKSDARVQAACRPRATATAASRRPSTAASAAAAAAANDDDGRRAAKTLRRILETQLAQLAWNDLTRRAPIHTEILRELTRSRAHARFRRADRRAAAAGTRPHQARRLAIRYVVAAPARHRRPLARQGRTRRARRPHRRRQDHLARQARRALGAAPRRAHLALISADCGPHRRARPDPGARVRCSTSPVYTADSSRRDSRAARRSSAHIASCSSTRPGSSQRDAQLAARLARARGRRARSSKPRSCLRPARRPAPSTKPSRASPLRNPRAAC